MGSLLQQYPSRYRTNIVNNMNRDVPSYYNNSIDGLCTNLFEIISNNSPVCKVVINRID